MATLERGEASRNLQALGTDLPSQKRGRHRPFLGPPNGPHAPHCRRLSLYILRTCHHLRGDTQGDKKGDN